MFFSIIFYSEVIYHWCVVNGAQFLFPKYRGCFCSMISTDGKDFCRSLLVMHPPYVRLYMPFGFLQYLYLLHMSGGNFYSSIISWGIIYIGGFIYPYIDMVLFR